MQLRNDERDFRIDSSFAALHSLDMAVVARTSVPVLISAPRKAALSMAIEVAAKSGGHGGTAAAVLMVDAADDRAVESTFTRAAEADPGHLRAVVVRDVDALAPAQQAALRGLVAESGDRACRIIATTSVPLFERVRQGSFDARLFYSLNVVHLRVGASLPHEG
jgi:transcriptional regulator of acetoin/glycerol metabolism